MANTFYKIYFHTVFAAKYHDAVIPYQCLDELFKIIGGTIKSKGHQSLLVGGVPDHVHILWSMSLKKEAADIPELVKAIKYASNSWLNDGMKCGMKFEWQEGYGCFSVSPTHREMVERYIKNQAVHHQTVAFLDEYERLLNRNDIDNTQYKFVPLIGH